MIGPLILGILIGIGVATLFFAALAADRNEDS